MIKMKLYSRLMSGYDLDENESFNSNKEKLNSGRFRKF
jgi:hypothetical protein